MVEESIHVKFDDKGPNHDTSELTESVADLQVSEELPEAGPSEVSISEVRGSEVVEPEVDHESKALPEVQNFEEAQDGSVMSAQPNKSFKYKDSRPKDPIIRNKDDPLRTISALENDNYILVFISLIEPTSFNEALSDDGWIMAMEKELNQFHRNDVRDLVPRPNQNNIIETKWVFRNKLNEQG